MTNNLQLLIAMILQLYIEWHNVIGNKSESPPCTGYIPTGRQTFTTFTNIICTNNNIVDKKL